MTDHDQPTCARCSNPTHDTAAICGGCTTWLTQRLQLVAHLAGEAAITIARQSHTTPTSSSHQQPEPEPWARNTYALRPTLTPVSLTAAADHDAATNTLTTWARHIHEQTGQPLPTVWVAPCPHITCDHRRRGRIQGPVCGQHQPPEHPLAVVATWLTDQLDWLARQPDADQAWDELGDACHLVENVIDRRADRWYAGPCDLCGAELHPRAGARTIRCPDCGATDSATERKTWLLEQIGDAHGGAAWCAATLTTLGIPCRATAIRHWADRGHLAPAAGDRLCDHDTCTEIRDHTAIGPTCLTGRALYRLADVRALAEDSIRRTLLRRHQTHQRRLAAAEKAAADTQEDQSAAAA